jgi:hypothetical protein
MVASLQRHKNLYQLHRYFYRGKTNGELKCRSCYVSVRVPNSFATTDHCKKYKYPTVLKRLRIFFNQPKFLAKTTEKS